MMNPLKPTSFWRSLLPAAVIAGMIATASAIMIVSAVATIIPLTPDIIECQQFSNRLIEQRNKPKTVAELKAEITQLDRCWDITNEAAKKQYDDDARRLPRSW